MPVVRKRFRSGAWNGGNFKTPQWLANELCGDLLELPRELSLIQLDGRGFKTLPYQIQKLPDLHSILSSPGQHDVLEPRCNGLPYAHLKVDLPPAKCSLDSEFGNSGAAHELPAQLRLNDVHS